MRILYGTDGADTFAVIGPGTAQALAAYGIEADLMPDVYDGAHLGQALVDALDPKERVLILRSAQGGSAPIPGCGFAGRSLVSSWD